METAEPIQRLVRELSKLPGIGEKSAMRLAYHILRSSSENARALAQAVLDIKESIKLCSKCFQLTDTDPCRICSDASRDAGLICVVEQPPDVAALDKAGDYNGLFHVLHGVISPLDGIGPDELKIEELIGRAQQDEVKEIIIATNPTKEGESTAVYLADRLRDINVRVTRIAHGIPVGGEVEYTDSATLGMALGGRREM